MYRERNLMQIAPNLYWNHCWLDCGPGWDWIILDLSRHLEKIIVNGLKKGVWYPDYYPVCAEVREKMGSLRFYMYDSTPEMDELIEEAESASTQTCEMCGCSGKMRNEGCRYIVRCDICFQRQKELACWNILETG